jgi:hypothetical protein
MGLSQIVKKRGFVALERLSKERKNYKNIIVCLFELAVGIFYRPLFFCFQE